MDLSITIEGFGLTWDSWKHLANEIEQMGFVGMFRSDHFTLPDPPDPDVLEAITSLTYLAEKSNSIQIGTLVSPLSFRDPVMLARQAMAIDDLSGGRMILGVGAGWLEREHTMFGYPLSDIKTRFDRFEEGVEIISLLIRSKEPVFFEGRFFQLHKAQLLPRPKRSTPILIGGMGLKRTMPLVARFADIWNCQRASIDVFKERSKLLDKLLIDEGRQPGDVKRTILLPAICWRNDAELEQRAQSIRKSIVALKDAPTDKLLGILKNVLPHIYMGFPQDLIEKINSLSEAGVEEVILQWFLLDDIDGLQIIADDVIPYLRN